MAQWSWNRASGNSAALSVWSGWWWENTTSVTSAGSRPSAPSGSRMSRREATMPGSTTAIIDPSLIRVTVPATRSPT
nr:hypothetical protein [Planotetraspora thailandica]